MSLSSAQLETQRYKQIKWRVPQFLLSIFVGNSISDTITINIRRFRI